MSEIINKQTKVKINSDAFRMFAERAISLAAFGKSAVITFVSDVEMCKLNSQFRGKNLTTDVLSFPYEADEFDTDKDFIGDIIISIEQAEWQAIENNLTLENEVFQLILHGILHLLGYDHETDNGEMNMLELKFRDKLNI